MQVRNLIVITPDEIRPDHLSCYGYNRIRTPNIDRIATEGVLFEECIAASVLTPICHGTILTGTNPPVHGVRDPFNYLQGTSIAEILKDRGYKTAAFVGSGILGSKMGFNRGFELFDEPQELSDEVWEVFRYPGEERQEEPFLWGSWWIPRMIDWIKANRSEPFFAWGHFYDTHEGSEQRLVETGVFQEGVLSEYCYYDAKVKLLDEKVIGPLLDAMQEMELYEDTLLVILTDHGTTLGDRPLPELPWRKGRIYPQHTTMFEHDVRVAWVMKGPGLPVGKRVKGMVRQVDLVPTIIDYLDIETLFPFDGLSLLPAIEEGESRGLVAYIEEMYPQRGPGDFQAVRTDRYKYIINRRNENEEEFYDLQSDPGEETNNIDVLDEEEQLLRKEARVLCDRYLGMQTAMAALSDEDQEKIKARLRMLGYIK